MPEVMAAVALRGGVIRRRIVAIKALASAITIEEGDRLVVSGTQGAVEALDAL